MYVREPVCVCVRLYSRLTSDVSFRDRGELLHCLLHLITPGVCVPACMHECRCVSACLCVCVCACMRATFTVCSTC